MSTKPAPPANRRPLVRLAVWGIGIAIIALAAFSGMGGFPSWQTNDRSTALSAAQQGSFADAEPLLLKVHEKKPDDVEIVRALSLGYLTTNRYDQAQEFLNHWCKLQPKEAEPFQRRLDLWLKQEKTAQAVADVQTVLQLQPNDFRGRQILAQLLFIDGRTDEAEREALICFKAQPKNAEIIYLLATIYQRQGQAAKAVEMVERMLAANPRSSPALALRGDLYLASGQVETAIDLLAKAAAGSPSDMSLGGYPVEKQWLNVVQGVSYLQDRPIRFYSDGQPPPLTQVLADQSIDHTVIMFQLGQALGRAGREEEARRVWAEMRWRRALNLWATDKLRDVNPSLQGEVVHAYLEAGKTELAVNFLKDILRRQSGISGTHLLLAECYDKQGKADLASEERRLASKGQ